MTGMHAAHDDHRWVTRPRLLTPAAAARIVLVEAPGGWGKTTLSEQLSESLGIAAVRARLPARSTTDGVVAALVRAMRRAGTPDLAEAMGAGDTDTQLDGLLAGLRARPEAVLLIVDEAHLLDHDAAIWLRSLADDLPSPHRLVVAGRSLDRVLTRRAGTATVWLTQADLRFTAAELSELGADGGTAASERVLAETDGWPAAVAIAARRAGAPVGDDATAQVLLPDGLLGWLLDDLLGDDRAALAALGVPPLLSPAVCEAVAGPDAWQRLVTSGLPLRAMGEWRALPDPVRAALAGDAVVDRERLAVVAATYDIATAVAFLSGLGELDLLAADTVRRSWSEFLELSVGEIAALLQLLGAQRVAAAPLLLLHAARAAELRLPSQRMEWVSRGLALTGDGPVHRSLLAEEVRDLARNAAPDAVERAEALLAALPSDESAARGRALLSLGVAHGVHSTATSLASADRCFTEAAGLFRLLGERRWESEALSRVAYMVNYHGGRPQVAAEQQAQSIALLATGSRDWAIALTYYCDILDHLGRSAEAEASARDAWELGRRLGDAMTTAYGAWSMAIVRAHVGDLAGTRRWLDEVERNPGNWLTEVVGQEFLAFGADLLGGLGDQDGAYAYRERVALRVGHGGTQSLLDVLDGRLEAMYGDPAKATSIFDRLDGLPYATIRAKWIRVLFRALAAKRSGDRKAATEYIERALELVEQIGVPDIHTRHEPVVVAMLADVWPGGAEETSGAQRRVVLLGGFAVVQGVELVTPSPGNPATLVKLLALRGTMSSEQAIDALWPDADVGTGRARLRNLLNRLRNQSGDVVTRAGEALQLSVGVTTDVAQFEAAVSAAFDAPAAERAGMARLALGAYAGDLLPGDVYEDWAAAPRERLRRRYLSLIDIVAEDSFARGDLDEGMRLLDLGIEHEPLEERRYLVAVRALLAGGRRAAAREMVLRASGALDELGLPMCDELVQIGRSLDVRSAS